MAVVVTDIVGSTDWAPRLRDRRWCSTTQTRSLPPSGSDFSGAVKTRADGPDRNPKRMRDLLIAQQTRAAYSRLRVLCCGLVRLGGEASAACRGLREPAVQLFAQLVGIVVSVRAAVAGDDDAGGRDAGDTGETDELPPWAHQWRRLPRGEAPGPDARPSRRDRLDR
jgi:hypothetical protein